MMIIFAWLGYLLMLGVLTLHWLISTPIIGIGLDTFNATINGSSYQSGAAKTTMMNLYTMFTFSWRWVVILALIFSLLVALTYLTRRDQGVYVDPRGGAYR